MSRAVKQGSRRWRSEATTDSLHRFFPNVRFTELRSREGKSTVRIDRKPRLMVGGQLHLNDTAVRSTTYGIEPYSNWKFRFM